MTYQQTIEKAQSVIEELRPNLQMDGSDTEFVSYEDGIVYVRLRGSCLNCISTIEQVKAVVIEHLKEYLSEVYTVYVLARDRE